MNPKDLMKMYDKVKGDLGKVASKIGTSGKEVFRYYVKDQLICGWTHIAWTVFWFGLSIVGLCLFVADAPVQEGGRSWTNGFPDYPDSYWVWKFIGLGTMVSAFAGALSTFQTSMRELLNPEYWAFSNLLSDLSDVKNGGDDE
jgi:hypothetical protein